MLEKDIKKALASSKKGYLQPCDIWHLEDKVKDAIAVTDIKDEFSYSSYQNEIEEGETYVGVFTGLFLFIAILSVITTMTRVVKKQRIQIGTLKALGFKKNKITNHYQSKNCHIQPWLKR